MDWMDSGSAVEPELVVQNQSDTTRRVTIGCRTENAVAFVETERIGPGRSIRWSDLPDESFEIGVRVENGPERAETFDPGSVGDEIRTQITHSDVTFRTNGQNTTAGSTRSNAEPARSDSESTGTPSQNDPFEDELDWSDPEWDEPEHRLGSASDEAATDSSQSDPEQQSAATSSPAETRDSQSQRDTSTRRSQRDESTGRPRADEPARRSQSDDSPQRSRSDDSPQRSRSDGASRRSQSGDTSRQSKTAASRDASAADSSRTDSDRRSPDSAPDRRSGREQTDSEQQNGSTADRETRRSGSESSSPTADRTTDKSESDSSSGDVDTIFCRTCGETVRKSAEICPECGSEIDLPSSMDTGESGSGAGSRSRRTSGSAQSAQTSASAQSRTGAQSDQTSASTQSGQTSDDSTNSTSDRTSSKRRPVSATQSMSLSRGIKYPTQEDGWLKTMAIGTLLELTTFLVIPQLLLQGYYIRVMRDTINGHDEPPEFDNWGGTLSNGVKSTTIALIYQAIPIAVFLFMALGTISGMLSGTIGLMQGLISLITAVMVSLVLFLLFLILMGPAIVNFAAKGSMGAAFDTDILRVAFSSGYLKAWGMIVVVSMATSTLLSIIAVIPVVNLLSFIIHPFAIKYASTVGSRFLAQGYMSALDI